MKPSTAVVGPARDIRLPTEVTELSCAPGLAVVLGKSCRDVAQSDADDVIAGYFVMTNVSAGSLGRTQSFESGMYETPCPVRAVAGDQGRSRKRDGSESGDARQRPGAAAILHCLHELADQSPDRFSFPDDASARRCHLTGAAEGAADAPSIQAGDQVESIVDRVGAIRNRVVR